MITDDVQSLVPRASSAVAAADAFRQQVGENFFAYDEIRSLSQNDQDLLVRLLLRLREGDQSVLQDLHTLVYEELPVDMEEFVLGRRYLGLKDRISDAKLQILIEFSHPSVRKAWIAAGSGGGKSFMASVVQSWMIYQVLCLKHPDVYYMLGPGSKIATVNLSTAKEQAKDVVFAEFIGRLSQSPWFAGRYEPLQGRCVFPEKGVYALSGGSAASSYFGYHTIMGTLDEASYMIDRQDRSLAEDLTEALTKSLSTRFPNAYKLMVISTLRSDDDYLYRNIERVAADGRVLVNTPDPYRPY